MAAEDSRKKLKRSKSATKKREENSEMGSPQLAQRDGTRETSGGNKKSKKLRNNKRKNSKITETEIDELDTPVTNEVEGRISGGEDVTNKQGEGKLQKSRKKKRKNVKSVEKVDELDEEEDVQQNEAVVLASQSKPEDSSEVLHQDDTRRSSKTGKSKKSGKSKKKSRLPAKELSQDNLMVKGGEDAEDEVYEMSSGDEDNSKGMKKWITHYHQSRPGLKVLQEKIDDFIMDHEAKQQEAKAEREAQAAEGGWTVVVQQKGRKKTTEAESGVAVGSVAQAAVLDKMTKKKNKDVGIDFYRFQKRDAHRDALMMLQSKFEQDKKRIQQMRATRKFRPY